MGSTYTRQSTFTDGDTITADLFNTEFDQLVAAFAATSGHSHDGTAGEGGPIAGLITPGITLGDNTIDVTLTFDGGSNDGVLKWMEDEDYFEFSDDILIASTEKLQFRDTAIYINSSADGQLDLVADTEIQIAATTIDINGAADISGNLAVGGNLTVTGTTTFNGGTITLGDAAADNVVFGADVDSHIIPDDDDTYDLGSASQEWRDLYIDGTAHIDTLDVDVNATVAGTLGVTGVLTGSSLDISGDIDVDGTTNLDAVDIDGAVQLDATLTVGANDQGYDVILYGDTASANMTWDTSADDLIFNGAAGLIVPDGQLTLGSTAVTSTAAELNLLDGVSGLVQADLTKLAAVDSTAAELNIVDGGTSATSTTVADADRVVMNDNGTMVQVAVTDLAAYFDDEITAMPNLVTTAATTVGALNSGSITSGFGTIDTGSSTITTTGLISGGSLDIDSVLINGTTIGHTDDTDLITLANGVVTVAGEVSMTTLDIGGTNVTSTAAELNILDGKAFLDEDNLASNSATGIASQQSIKAYVDASAGSNIVATGALNSGSITSGFGSIDNGSSTITTTGLISGGSLDIDNVLINGTTIGHTDDTDLITLANGVVTVAGEVSMTTLDIGGTNVTSTAAELNALDGITAVVGELNALDLGSTAVGTAIASKAVVLDSNKDYTGIRNFTITGNLSVGGTTTVVDTVTMNAQNAVLFEGATADAHETTLTIVDPTADRTINLPNQSGTLPVLAASSNTAITSTPEELNILDGVTATAAELNILDVSNTTIGDLSEISTAANDDVFIAVDTSGGGLKKITRSVIIAGTGSSGDLANVVEDTSPQLGGNLDLNGNDIVTTSNANLDLAPNGTGTVVVRGNTTGGSNVGAIVLNCENNSHGQTVKAQPHSASVTNTMLLPAGANSTLVSLVSTDTLTNKTLTSPKINEDVAVTSTATELNLLDGVTATTAELNILDGITAVVGELNALDLGSTAVGTAIASKAMVLDSNKDYTGVRNFTLSGELDAGSLDISGNADIDGTLEADAITVNGTALATVIAGTTVTNATNSAHVLVTDNESTNEENLIAFVEGATSSTGNVGLEMDGNLSYNPSTGTVSATIFKGNIDAVDGDFDGTLEADAISIGGTTITSTAAELNALDGITAVVGELNALDLGSTAVGTAIASKAMILDSNKDYTGVRNFTLSGELDAGSLDVSGNVDVDGTLETDALSINGTTVTSTAAEINLIDGGTARGTTAVADGDGVLINDAGTMRMTKVDTLSTYMSGKSVGGSNIVTTGALNSGSITSGFGNIDTGSSTITTTGLISGGSLDIDNVLINGTTIGHTDDTDLITVADGLVTVAGEVQMTTLDIGGTNVTSTAAELNLLDGSSANSVVNSKAVIYGSSGELAGALSTAAQTNVTSLGTLTALTVDDVAIDGKVMTMTGSSSDTAVFTVGTNGTLSIVTTDDAAAAANIQITADGTAELAGTTVTLDSGGDIDLAATNDVNLPANVGLTFGNDGEKIEGDGTNLAINSSGDLNVTATTIDIDGNVEISGTAVTTGVHTFTAVPVFPNDTVETADIQADAITGAKIADNAINSEHYTDGSIDTAHIADAQITVAKMAANSVDSDQYVDGSIDTAHIADANVTQAKIADQAINEAKMQISNAPTNGYFLSAQSGNTGGLTWAAGGGSTTWGAVGTYTVASYGSSLVSAAGTVSGSSLKTNAYSSGHKRPMTHEWNSSENTSLGVSGTWRNMTGAATSTQFGKQVNCFWVRIS